MSAAPPGQRPLPKTAQKLGNRTVSAKQMELHGLISIARQASCNPWYTNLAARMVSRWRLKLFREKVQDVGKGKLVANARQWLPEKLRNVVFRDQYVVALVGGGGETKYRMIEQ